jgi:hypothetical protein
MHYYLVKLAIVLAVVVGLKRVFKISFLLPLPRWTNRMPIWLLGLVDIFVTTENARRLSADGIQEWNGSAIEGYENMSDEDKNGRQS